MKWIPNVTKSTTDCLWTNFLAKDLFFFARILPKENITFEDQTRHLTFPEVLAYTIQTI